MTQSEPQVQDGNDQEQQGTPVTIRTVEIGPNLEHVAVVLDWGSEPLVLVSDAAAQVALELLSAAYAARAEMALKAKLKELVHLDPPM